MSRAVTAAALTATALLIASAPAPLAAQIKASEAATTSQIIDGTEIHIAYSRPSTRGRSDLFGGVVPWGERWTPGANYATRFNVSKDIHLSGVPVPAGTYSLWIDVLEDEPWVLVLDPDSLMYHTQHPPDADDQIKVPVERSEGPPMDALLWYFATVRADGGELRMHWGEHVASFDVAVEPTQRMTVTPEEAAVYEGHWTANWMGRDGEPGPEWSFDLARNPDTGVLTATMTSGPGGDGSDVYFLPRADGIFAWGWGADGEVWEVTEFLFEFSPVEGHADRFEARDGQDRLQARGTRADADAGH